MPLAGNQHDILAPPPSAIAARDGVAPAADLDRPRRALQHLARIAARVFDTGGLSSVDDDARRRAAAATAPIGARLPVSRSPPAPNTVISRPPVCGLSAAIAASSASGVWA